MSVQNIDILLRNNTGNTAKNRLIDGFVIRNRQLGSIVSNIHGVLDGGDPTGVLVVGQRGAGKTTLLHRVKYAVEDDSVMSKALTPMMFGEEQYHITDLSDFWEAIADYLREEYPEFVPADIDVMAETSNSGDQNLHFIEKVLLTIGKRIVLFIENLDTFLKKIGSDGQLRLRSYLEKARNILVVASSTTDFEDVANPKGAFFNFFQIYHLRGLSKDETLRFLLKIGQQTDHSLPIKKFLRINSTKVEALRRLTGGNPRMISYLYNIFLDNASGKAIKDLYRLLDDLTFLYKAELDQLSTQQQKLIDSLARSWDAISVKELVLLTKMESKHVSSVLATLEKLYVVEKISTKTKNNLYLLRDRFLNIWYLMRFGRKRDRENVIWLVRFYDLWCDKKELSLRIGDLIRNIEQGGVDSNVALDMANTFLSCKNVSSAEKYRIYQMTKSAFPKTVVERLSKDILYNSIRENVRTKNFGQALKILDEVDRSDSAYDSFSYWIYFSMGDYERAVESLKNVFEVKQDDLTAHTLGQIYEFELRDFEKAENYYKIAAEKGRIQAYRSLGNLFYHKKNDFESAQQVMQAGIDLGDSKSIMGLATMFYYEGKMPEAEELCLLAIRKGDTAAYLSLSVLYMDENRVLDAIEAVDAAIAEGQTMGLIRKAEILQETKSANKMEIIELFDQAISNNVPGAHLAAGRYYFRKLADVEKGEKLLLIAARQKNKDAAHLLGHLYCETKRYNDAERWFVRSIELGRKSALLCLLNCVITSNLRDKSDLTLQLFEKSLADMRDPNIVVSLQYARLLFWSGQSEKAKQMVFDLLPNLTQLVAQGDENDKEALLESLTDLFIQLIGKNHLDFAWELFSLQEFNLRQMMKPVYFALTKYLSSQHPNEFLRIGSEMKETVEEIISEIEKVKNQNV